MMRLFRASELKPRGWLRHQLEIQADGLAGNLDKVWRDVRDSKWIGGDCAKLRMTQMPLAAR